MLFCFLIEGRAKGSRTMAPMKKRSELKVKGPTWPEASDWATKESPQIALVSSKRSAAFLCFIFFFLKVRAGLYRVGCFLSA